MSINSQDILEKTGLKSAKTLTRWHKRGIIPEPVVRTHPSGRGKMAYWPDCVLERCVKLVELQKEGHTLNSALATIERERINRNLHEMSYTITRNTPHAVTLLDSLAVQLDGLLGSGGDDAARVRAVVRALR